MPSPVKLDASIPSASRGALARSRSRYKGVRPNTLSTTAGTTPSFNADLPQQSTNGALSRGRRREITDDIVPLEVANAAKSEHSEETINHATEKKHIHPSHSVRQTSDSREQSKNDGTMQPPISDKGGRRLDSSHPGDSAEHRPRSRRTALHSRRAEEQSAPQRSPAQSKTSLTQRVTKHAPGHSFKDREKLKRTISGPIAVQPPLATVAPAFDAPISAVNAGERRVTVKWEQTTISLPVTPSTTPLDIIDLFNDQMTGSMTLERMIVVESYRQLGLERPLRMYERVRDVLNSWDNDTQNSLLIIPSPTDGKDDDLNLRSVSDIDPQYTSVSIYHSQRPGKWDKRLVTLRTDGQIVLAKNDTSETSNICHLSDFDIYIPTARQLSKKIRPPRKTCFTVKSQQKSSMFMSTVNFVHFFSTSDKTLATAWYKAIQEWRSWYLVNVMGEGQRDSRSPQNEASSFGHVKSTSDQSRLNERGKSSSGNRDRYFDVVRENATPVIPVRSRRAPSVSFPKKLTKDNKILDPSNHKGRPSITSASPKVSIVPEPFADTGLLRRTYTKRRQAQQSRQPDQIARSSPPIAIPVTTSQSDGIKRASSQRPITRPLVDLTPQYREPPQHARKGRGIVPEQTPAGGLVEIATSPEAAIETPPAIAWQRPNTSSGPKGPDSGVQQPRTARRELSTGPPQAPGRASTSPEKAAVAFTGGLLGRNNQSQGGIGIGRGVMTGDRHATAPMLNMALESDYAPGSLLAHVEKHDGGPRPVLERERGRER